MTARRRKIKANHQHVLVYLVLAALPVAAYFLANGHQHIPEIQQNIDEGLTFIEWLADRLVQSLDVLVALVAAAAAFVYTIKSVIKRKGNQ